jgi:hypothetical protein
VNSKTPDDFPFFREMPVEPSDTDISAAPESVQTYIAAMEEVQDRQEKIIAILMDMDVFPDILARVQEIAEAPLEDNLDSPLEP